MGKSYREKHYCIEFDVIDCDATFKMWSPIKPLRRPVSPGIEDSATCYKPMDVVLLLDASGSIMKSNAWDQEIDFAESIRRQLSISSTGSHLGLIYYGYRPVTKIDLNVQGKNAVLIDQALTDLRSNHDTSKNFTEYTNTHLALAEAHKMFSQVPAGRKVKKTLVVVTDGLNSYGKHYLIKPSQQLKDSGVTIITVGVAVDKLPITPTNNFPQEAEEELQLMASRPSLVFRAKTFDKLKKAIDDFRQHICPVDGGQWCPWKKWSACTNVTSGKLSIATRSRACECPKPAHNGRNCQGLSNETRACVCKPTPFNLVMVLDASHSMKEFWKNEYKFARELYKTLRISDDTSNPKSHLGLIYFAVDAISVLRLNDKVNQNPAAFEKKLEELKIKGQEQANSKLLSETYTTNAIVEASKMFKNVPSNRKSLQNVLVFITDGVSYHRGTMSQGIENMTLDSTLRDLKKTEIVLIMTIGVRLNQLKAEELKRANKELNFIASTIIDKQRQNKTLFYPFNNFQTLLKDVADLAKAICKPSQTNVVEDYDYYG